MLSDERTLLVGVELGEETSQITCFNPNTYEPESICFKSDPEKYLIPTVLFYRRDTGDWTFGEEALEWNREKDGVLVKHLVSKASQNELVVVDDREVEPKYLLERFIKRLLGMLKVEYPNDTIRSLVITVKEKNMILIDNIYSALQGLGISKLRASVQSHEQCFVNYAMNQPKELRVNDIVLFDFNEEGLRYYQISVNRRTEPPTVVLNKRDFKDILPYSLLQNNTDMENVAYVFESITMNVLHKQIVSTVYVTGVGFEDNWCKDVLKKLCVGRRVFAGQNLYAKGACYAAREMIGEGRLKNYLYLGEEMLAVNIYTPMFTEAKNIEYPLVEAGTAWYNANKTISFIPDGEIEVELLFEYVVGNQVEHHFVTMDGLWNMERKTRIEMSIEFSDTHTCIVRLHDRGFGEIYPSSNRVWEKIIPIQGNTTTKEQSKGE
ncbi:MAG: hypothetical protein K5895_11535 [Lachnospiraceae bacterium]|nr:hypothetical protein [Lachnospiraceae bacterium]